MNCFDTVLPSVSGHIKKRHSAGLRLGFAQYFDNSQDAIRTLMWHNDQKTVSALILAICAEAHGPLQTRKDSIKRAFFLIGHCRQNDELFSLRATSAVTTRSILHHDIRPNTKRGGRH